MDKKINLNQSEFQSEDEMKSYLCAVALEYASTMNEIERDISAKSDANPETDFFPEYKERYLPVFNAYCSEKRRVYGGQADSYGSPPQYDGIEKYTEQRVELKTKSRAEAYFKTNSYNGDDQAEYLFVLLRKNGLWRIDSFKYSLYGFKWSNGIL